MGRLQQELTRLFEAPRFDHTLWGVKIQSLDTGQVLYRLNATKLMMPASNMKIVTLAASVERLGWDYRFETELRSAAPIENGVLQGDLIVRGSGDPTLNDRHGDRTAPFQTWANELKALGIKVIDGRIVGDDNVFDEADLGAGWAWDYLGYGYAAPGGALQYNENIVSLKVHPGEAPGDPVVLRIEPAHSGLQVRNRAWTSPADGDLRLDLQRLPGQPTLEVVGSVPVGTPPFTRTASVHNPTEFFVEAFRSVLIANGIEVRGEAVDIDAGSTSTTPGAEHGTPARLLVSHRSPPLSEAGTILMKVSQNLYAETLLKTLGSQAPPGTVEAGRKVVRQVLTSWGIAADQYIQYDGSGLSRYNYVTPEMLVTILRQMHRDPRHAAAFEATLPIAGCDGALEHRMTGTRAEGNAKAKTGSIANVRALSGYVHTRDNEQVAFSIIANHFHLPQSAIDAVTDLAVERLANLSRRE